MSRWSWCSARPRPWPSRPPTAPRATCWPPPTRSPCLLAEDGNALGDSPGAFVSNRLTLVTPPDDPAGIESLADLDDPDVDYVVCAETAPCGAVAVAVLEEAGIGAPPASEEVDVKAVLARVVQGEADAGLVYRTDAVAAGDDVARGAGRRRRGLRDQLLHRSAPGRAMPRPPTWRTSSSRSSAATGPPRSSSRPASAGSCASDRSPPRPGAGGPPGPGRRRRGAPRGAARDARPRHPVAHAARAPRLRRRTPGAGDHGAQQPADGGRLHRARHPAGVAAGARRLPRAPDRARARAGPAGPAPGRGRRRAGDGAGPQRPDRAAPAVLDPLHDVGRGAGPHVRLAPVLRPGRRGRAAHARRVVRRRGRDAGRRQVDDLPPGDPAARRAGRAGGERAGLGPQPRGVRRDDHLRRQLPRHHPDDAEPDLRGAQLGPDRGAHPQPDPARPVRRGPGAAARALGGRRDDAGPGRPARTGVGRPLGGGRRGPGRDRTQRRREVHAPARDRRPRARPGAGRRRRLDRPRGPAAAGGLRLPGPEPLPPPVRPRQRRLRAAGPGSRPARGRRRGPRLARALRDRRPRRTAGRASSPAARRSGSRSPAPSPPTRRCCSSTSRSPASTCRCRWRCASSSAGTCATSQGSPCS